MDRRLIVFLALAAVGAGCSSSPPPAFPEWVTRSSMSSGADADGFQLYVRAAQEAEAKAGPLADRLKFTPKMRTDSIEACEEALRLLRSATRQSVTFQYELPEPFQPKKHEKGWRLLSRVLIWKTQQAAVDGNYALAITHAATATRFGFDLTAGPATTASLGLATIDEARQALAPYLGKFSPKELNALASEIEAALKRRPDLELLIEHERQNMLLGVQAVQDAYQAKRYEELVANLSRDVQPAIDYLENMRKDDRTERPVYFRAFAEEAKAEAEWALDAIGLPRPDRPEPPKPDEDAERPWRRFTKHFFQTLRPLLDQYDATLARTKLLCLEARLRARLKGSGETPRNLEAFGEDLVMDPYSGIEFRYRSAGGDYKVYSVGANGLDDGGTTNESFSEPDLKLEGSF